MGIRLEDLPDDLRRKVEAHARPIPKKRKPVVVRSAIFCTRCGSYEHSTCIGRLNFHPSFAEFAAPIRTENEQNGQHGHWAVKAGKRDAVRNAMHRAWKGAAPRIRARLRVTITRISAGTLDGTNLDAALKSVVDQLAAELKVDDASPLVEWVRQQEKGATGLPAVRVEIEEIA